MTLMIFHRVLIGSAIVFLLAYGIYELVADGAAIASTTSVNLPADLERSHSEGGDSSLLTGVGMIAGAVVLGGYFVWLIRQPLPPRDVPEIA